MPPVMPLDVQWFVYALVSNEVLTESDARQIYLSLGLRANMDNFVNHIATSMCDGLDEESTQSVLGQLQELVDYAVEQSQTGEVPPSMRVVKAQAVTRTAANTPTSTPLSNDDDSAEKKPYKGVPKGEVTQEPALHFDMPDYDLSGITAFTDLPSFSDTSFLSDDELVERMILMLACLRSLGCSDLHISGGSPVFVRRQLVVERIDDYILTSEDSRRLNTVMLSWDKKAQFEEEFDINFALEVGTSRFRVCLMEHKDGVEGSYRLVPESIRSLKDLGFLDHDIPNIERLLDYNNGLILLTGPIGAGKTTTLASMIDVINENRTDHVISVEDPIEILQYSKNCQVTQREIGRHTVSYHTALKGALREDPDVIVIGEMHDLETIEKAITASETGHLVIGTMHTSDAPNTLNRLLDVFPPSQQAQIRAMTAGSLRGVICQKIINNGMGGTELVYEILLNNMAVANTITEGKAFRLKSTMSTSNKIGMCILDQCILEKYIKGLLTKEAALAHMTDASIIAQLNQHWATEQAKLLGGNQ